MVKPEVGEEAEANQEIWGHKNKGNVEKCDQIYIKDETLPARGVKREIADDDRAVIAVEQLATGGKVKRRRAGSKTD